MEDLSALILKMAAEQGIVPDPQTVHGNPVDPKELDDKPQRVLFHGQAVLRSLEHPTETRLTKVCKECGDPFTSNYHSVAYCSTLCCEIACKRDFGLAWTPHSRIKKQKWEVRAEPEIVSLQALKAMKLIVAKVEADLGRPIEIDEQAFSKLPSGLLKESSLPSASESPSASEPPEALPLGTPTMKAPQEPSSESLDLDSFLDAF